MGIATGACGELIVRCGRVLSVRSRIFIIARLGCFSYFTASYHSLTAVLSLNSKLRVRDKTSALLTNCSPEVCLGD